MNKRRKNNLKLNLQKCIENCHESCKRTVLLKIDKTEEICNLKCSLACNKNLLNKLLN